MGGDEEDEPLLDVVDHAPAFAHAIDERRERVVPEHEVGRLAGNGRPAAHRDGNIGGVERGSVIDPVSRDRHEATGLASHLDEPALLVRRRAGDDPELREVASELLVRPRLDLRS